MAAVEGATEGKGDGSFRSERGAAGETNLSHASCSRRATAPRGTGPQHRSTTQGDAASAPVAEI